jgi:pimeloyl-ACP methyl ester carboxylesterase
MLSTGAAIAIAGFLLGILLLSLLAIVEFGAWALVVPARPGKANETTQGGSPPLPQGRPIFTRARDGVRLAGRWHDGAEVSPGARRTVLLIHGFAERSEALQARRVEVLTHHGWNVAAIDLRAYGQSGGDRASFGGREADDLRCWLDSLGQTEGEENGLLPVLWGRSMGAAIALRVAAEDARIKALVLESPMIDLNEALAVWFRRRRLPLAGILARFVTRRAARLAGVSLTRPSPLRLAPGVRCPVLILHGRDDTLVRPADVRRLAGALPVAPTILEVPGAGHTDVVDTGGGELLDQVARFLDAACR